VTKVFAIESGSYSDYRVERLFSNREAAERYIERANAAMGGYYTPSDIVERELLDECPELVTVHHHTIAYDGRHHIRSEVRWADELGDGMGRTDQNSIGQVSSRAAGRTPEEARKAALDGVAERRAMLAGIG
jgi:hypothetical protein